MKFIQKISSFVPIFLHLLVSRSAGATQKNVESEVENLKNLVLSLKNELNELKAIHQHNHDNLPVEKVGKSITILDEATPEEKQAERARIYYLDATRERIEVSARKTLNHDGSSSPRIEWGGQIVFEDDFEGETLNEDKWMYQEGATGYGGNNLETYNRKNVQVVDGNLVIKALVENLDGKNYTSGRIKQKGPGFVYGAYVARARVPLGKHLWPAFWLLNFTDCKYEEIDILEYRGQNPRDIEMTAHYGRNWSAVVSKGSLMKTTPFDLSADFHEYALLWLPTKLSWFVDSVQYAEVSLDPQQWRNEGDHKIPCGDEEKPFAEKQNFILNMAIGGGYFGQSGELTMDDARRWPKNTFEVDWVRIYQE